MASNESSNFGCAEGLHVPPGPGISGRGSGCVRGGATMGPMGSTGSGRITGGPTKGSGTESDESSNFSCAAGLHVPPGPGISGRSSGCFRGGAAVGPMGSTGIGSGRITGGPTTGSSNFGCGEGLHIPPGPGISGRGSGCVRGGAPVGPMGSTGNGSGRITGGPTSGPMGISGDGSGSITGGSITGSMIISSELALPKFVRWSDKRAAIVQMRSRKLSTCSASIMFDNEVFA